jgi:peptidoglycan/xylan/chitin deacetylase (PgdA/CDA1 family)
MKKQIFSLVLSIVLVSSVLTGLSLSRAETSTTGRGYISLTFDDGILSQYTTVFPLLQQYGLVGTFYIPTGAGPLGAIAPDGLPYNKINQIPISGLQEMQAAGMEIGSHSVTHNNFCDMTQAQMTYEASQSLATLQSWGLTVTDFAYPYGTGDLTTANNIVSQYYNSGRDVSWNPVSLPTSNFEIMGYDIEYLPGTGMSYSNVLSYAESYVNYAIANNVWVCLLVHNVVGTSIATASADEQNCIANGGITYADFNALLGYIQYEESLNGLQVLTVHQALSLGASLPAPTVNPTSTPTPISTPAPTTEPTSTPQPTTTPISTTMPNLQTVNPAFWSWFIQQPQVHYKSQAKQAAYENQLLTEWENANP